MRPSRIGGTATPDEDYLANIGDVVIPPGALDGYLTIELFGDATEESAETIELAIDVSGPVSVTADTVTATIANDDSQCDTPFSKDTNPWLVNGADPLNFAHRGGVTDFPENTLYAYAEAAKAGADVLEMDVYQTRDNELVILHDLTVDRTTDGSGGVVDLTLAELRALDAAYWFVQGQGTPHDLPETSYLFRGIATGLKPPPPGYSAEDFRIPTLEEALARFPHNLINIELKPDLDGSGNYEVQMAELLQRYGRSTDMIAASFVDEAAVNFKAAAPCIYTSIPLGQGTDLITAFLGTGEFPAVPEHITWQAPPDTSQIGQVDIELEIVTAEFVEASHAANLAVQVWTINSCEEMLRMIDLGVDAIMTDAPLLLAEVLATPPAERSCD
ncbi:MAG: glycerophosphodiester phosphodiesterase [Halioglobus sp.]